MPQRPLFIGCLALALALWAVQASGLAQVFRWVDERGVVHYGDAVPERYQGTARPMDLQGTVLTQAQKAQAEARLEADRQFLKVAPPAPAASRPKVAAIGPLASAGGPQAGLSCEQQWARYEAAWQCLNPYRNANGSVKPEGFALCPVLTQPTLCDGGGLSEPPLVWAPWLYPPRQFPHHGHPWGHRPRFGAAGKPPASLGPGPRPGPGREHR